MYRLLLLSIVLVSVQTFSPEDMPKCERFLKPGGISCCKKQYLLFDNIKDREECSKLPMKPPACEAQTCFAKKAGFALDSGNVDRAALGKLLEKEFEDEQDLLGKLIKNCIDSDVSKYGLPEFCELLKVKTCIDVIIMKECREWDSAEQCSGAEEMALECIKLFM